MLNVEYLLNADLAAKEFLLELSMLCHFGIDIRSLLEENRDLLDGSGCYTVHGVHSDKKAVL